MTFAAVGDTGYDMMLLLHILSAMVAFAPLFVHPLLANQIANGLDPAASGPVFGFLAANGRKLYAPALVITGIVGFGVAGMSDKVYELSDGWLAIAVLVWIAQNGVLHALIIPGDRALAGGDSTGVQKAATGAAILGALLLVQLVLMVAKPGA